MWSLENAPCGPLLCNDDLYIQTPVRGGNYEYMGIVGYKYRGFMKLHATKAYRFYGFHNHGDHALIFIQSYHGKGNSILFGLHSPHHHSWPDDAMNFTHQSAHLGGGMIYWPKLVHDETFSYVDLEYSIDDKLPS